MAVNIHSAALRVVAVHFEARYDEGYRYLDRCGETLVRVMKRSPSWLVGGANPTRANLTNHELKLAMSFSHESLVVGFTDELDLTVVSERVERLSQEAEAFYRIVIETLKVPNTTRVGLRCQLIAPADSLEEAAQFMTRGFASPFRDALVQHTRLEPRNATMLYVLEDAESGLRRKIEVSSGARVLSGTPALTGLATDKGSGVVLADVDTFTRPDTGHLPRVDLFVIENYAAGSEMATYALEWLRQHQSRK